MTDSERLVELRALVTACNASRRVAVDDCGNQTDTEHYLIPRGAWDSLVKTAELPAAP